MEPSNGYRIDELARRFGLEARGDSTRVIGGVAPLARAEREHLAFLANPRYASELAHTRAGVVVLGAEHAGASPVPVLIAKDPYLAYARIAALFDDTPAPAPGIHPTAVIAADARVDATASVGPGCVIEAGAIVEAGAVLGPHCVVGPQCTVGAQSRLGARVTLVTRVVLGKRVLIHAGAVLGADGFGLARDEDGWVKVPQLGGVRIGDDCEIGANTTIDRGALDTTRIGRGTKIDNLVHIGHNCQFGEDVIIAAQAGFSGSITIENNVVIGGQVGVGEHARIQEGVLLGGQAGVLPKKILRGKGIAFWGTPAKPLREYLKSLAALARLGKKE